MSILTLWSWLLKISALLIIADLPAISLQFLSFFQTQTSKACTTFLLHNNRKLGTLGRREFQWGQAGALQSALPGWPSPVGPGLLAEHFVPLQAGLVGLPEGVARPPDPHVLQQPQVPDLVAHQGLVENVCSLLVIGLDAPAKENQKGRLLTPYTPTNIAVTLNHTCIIGHRDLFLLFITSSKTFTKSLAVGNLPDVVWIFRLEVFHQGSNWSLELRTCCWRSLQIDLSRVSFWEQGFDKGVVGFPHGLGQVTVQEVVIFVNKSFHLVHNLSNREISLAQVLNYDTDQVKTDPRNWFFLLTHCPKGAKGISALKSDIWMTFCWIKCLWTRYLRKMHFLILPTVPCVNQFWFLKWKKPFFLW